jgi:hypothetical protein
MMLSFGADPHEYRAEDGHLVESVTQIMHAEGFRIEYQENPAAAAWGNRAHSIVREYGQGTLNEYPEAFQPWMDGILKFFGERMPVGKYEQIVHRKQAAREYAGTLDFEGMIRPSPRPWILDWKFWAGKSPTLIKLTGIQTAGYAVARFGPLHPCRGLVWFYEGGYELIPLRDESDYVLWQSILNCHFWRRRHLNGNVPTT